MKRFQKNKTLQHVAAVALKASAVVRVASVAAGTVLQKANGQALNHFVRHAVIFHCFIITVP